MFTMYGGGFATIPAFLADIFGPDNVGAIHGALLTAWSGAAVAGPVIITELSNRAKAALAAGRRSGPHLRHAAAGARRPARGWIRADAAGAAARSSRTVGREDRMTGDPRRALVWKALLEVVVISTGVFLGLAAEQWRSNAQPSSSPAFTDSNKPTPA